MSVVYFLIYMSVHLFYLDIYLSILIFKTSVSDPLHFDVDPDPRIHFVK